MKRVMKSLILALVLGCSSTSSNVNAPPTADGSIDGDTVARVAPWKPSAEEIEVTDTVVVETTDSADASTTPEVAIVADEPKTISERFVAAGGVKLCEAFVIAMSPEWGLDLCAQKVDPENRRQCEESRKPLLAFANQICVPIVEDSVHFNLDPGMIVAVYENESNLGKVRFNRWTKQYWIGTDIRPPANRDRGETGLPQLLPPNYRSGTCVGPLNADGSCNGEVLRGTQYDRRALLIEHPEWQARLGVREIAKHRDICVDYSDRVESEDFWTFVSMYNQGHCKQDPKVLWHRWIVYAMRVMKNYLRACESTMTLEDGTTRLISEVWDECERVEMALPGLQRQQ